MMRFIVATALVAASLVSATDHPVMVGQGGKVFTPSNITAEAGDTVTFTFGTPGTNHTATQSTFATPCTQMQNTSVTPPIIGISSGFISVPAGSTTFPQWKIGINDATTPLWFFCAQTGHCQAGMVFSVNANANKTFDAYQAAAKLTTTSVLAPETNGSQTPPSSTGGVSSGGSSSGGSSSSGSTTGNSGGAVVSPSSPNGTGTSAAPASTTSSPASRGATAASAPYALSLLALALGVAL